MSTLQEQIVDAWAKAPNSLHDAHIIDNVNFTIGLLVGAGYPNSAMFVLALAQEVLGAKDHRLVGLRKYLGLPE